MEAIMNATDKQLVKKQFSRGISTYNKAASVQKRICAELTSRLKPYLSARVGKVFEIGSGTGFLTDQLLGKVQPTQYIANDLIPESELEVAKVCTKWGCNWSFTQGDAEQISYPDGLDLIASASAIQWFDSFDAFCGKAASSLNKNGLLAFASFGPDNYIELKNLLGAGLDYLTLDEHVAALEQHFDILHAEESIMPMHFERPLDVLRHIKTIGANGITKEFWSRKRMMEFETAYSEQYKDDNGVRLTYHPVMFVCRRK